MKVKKVKKENFLDSVNKRVEEHDKLLGSLIKMVKRINIYAEEIDAVIPAEVKRFGNSGHIPFSKRFIGRQVKVNVLKEKKEDTDDKKV